MRRSIRSGLVLLPLLMLVCATPSAQAQSACDRACVTKITDDYFAALVAHDPKKVAIARDDEGRGEWDRAAVQFKKRME